jgi:hypothetical protein
MKLRTYRKFFILILGSIFFYSCQSSSTLKREQVKNENVNCDFEKVIYRFESTKTDSSHLLIPSDSSRIIFYFFDGFQDTVAVSYNKINFLVGSVFEDFNSTSTKYSGVHFGVEVNPQVNLIKLELLRQRKCVFINLYSQYPICTLSRENDVWIVNYRIRELVLK